MDIKITPNTLNGTVKIPASKSLSHRAIIAAALSQEPCVLHNVILSDDIFATLTCMEQLGAQFTFDTTTLHVSKCEKLKDRTLHFECNESGSTLRFLIPIALTRYGNYHFQGKGRLSKRPQGEYIKIFESQHIEYERLDAPLELPLKIVGALRSGKFFLRGDISSQFITGLLFALPLLEGTSEIHLTTPLESKAYVDLTLDVLNKFSIEVQVTKGVYHIPGGQKFHASSYSVEGDYSQAAFWFVAGCLTKGSGIEILGISNYSKQGDSAIIEILKSCGAELKELEGAVKVSSSEINGFECDLAQIPDLGPILTVLACFAKGKSRLYNGTRLRIKESDRVTSMVTELSKMGAIIQEIGDEIHVEGQECLEGGVTLSSWGDHRVAMALSIAAIRCKKSVVLTGAECVSKSYLKFWDDYKALGGVIDEL